MVHRLTSSIATPGHVDSDFTETLSDTSDGSKPESPSTNYLESLARSPAAAVRDADGRKAKRDAMTPEELTADNARVAKQHRSRYWKRKAEKEAAAKQ